MKPINECKTVAELLESPERWIKGSMYDNFSWPKQFCLYGAICHIYGPQKEGEYCDKIRTVLAETPRASISLVQFNDAPERTHSEVLEAVRKAGI
jgi:hypothetical protein